MHFHFTIQPLGNATLLLQFGNEINIETNKAVLAAAQQLQEHKASFVKDIVPAYNSLAVHYNAAAIWQTNIAASPFDTAVEWVENTLCEEINTNLATATTVHIPVCYQAAYAPDLENVAAQTGLSIKDIVNLHSSTTYHVYCLGFLPGFAYMGTLSQQLVLPRKKTPQPVPAGAVGIAAMQTGIYPFASPGGWHIIGRTPLRMFDAAKSNPVLLQPGSTVQFYPISTHEFENY